ncbi:MAG: AI-2E family transporter [Chthoniobacteraceae bacterium]
MNGNTQLQGNRLVLFLTVGLVVAALFFARDFLVPLALAALISFLLAPLIRRFERWRMGRIGSVLTATALAFTVIGIVGYIVAGQLIDLANQLPEYQTNLRAKISAFKTTPNSPMGRLTKTLRELTQEIAATDVAAPAPANADTAPPPMPVAVVATSGNALQTLTNVVTPIIGPLGTAAIVIVFVIFMLLEREDLRDRVIHLVGRGRLQVTTQALDDAGQRVSRYLLAQLVVNVTYGIPIGLGLYFIGIPNAVLWGCLAAILRFVPYLGPFLAASFPLILSLAISPSWNTPLLAGLLFVVVELISNNVVEPWLYGSSTGLSPIAIIISAVFWTWLWGGVGLLLATPLTVCIAVLGKYIPSLQFLDVLLGDKPPIAAEERFYQRLLAMDGEEALALAEARVAHDGLAATFDELIVPALRQAERDFREGTLSDASRHEMCREMRELIAGLGEFTVAPETGASVLCVPASNEVDELGAFMLARLLTDTGLSARVLPSKLMTGELVEEISAAAPAFVCVSVLSSWSLMPATQLCKKVRERVTATLAVGVWGTSADDDERRSWRLKRTHADHVFSTLTQAAAEIRAQPALAIAPVPPVENAA